MKKNKAIFKNCVAVVIFYILIMFLNNIKSIFHFIINPTSDININFINISIVLSVALISLLYIFRKFIFKKQIYLWIIFCSMLIYNFAEGYFSGFVVYPFIILYLYILLITYVMIVTMKKNFEISIVTGFSGLLIITFVIGMFGLLNIVKYLIIISTIIMIVYIYKIYKKDKNRLINAKDTLFSSGFVIFNILWIFAILGGAGMYVNSWDEYSHWAYDAKATIYYSKFGASQEIMSKTKGYAPIFTVWHYIVSIFNGFSEHNLYIGLSMLISIYLLPAFSLIKKHNIITKILAFLAITFCCYIFGGVYIYSSLYADLAIAVMFSAILIFYNISVEDKNNLTIPIVLLLVIITLSKTNGFVIAFIFIFMIFISKILSNKLTLKNIVNCIKDFFKKYYKFIIAIILTFIIWKLYLFIMGNITTEYYDFTLLPDSLKGDLSVKLDPTFVRDFCKNVLASFDSNLITGKINLSLYQFLIIIFATLFVLFYIKNDKKISVAIKKIIPYILGYIVFFALTVLSMFLMMSKYEASNLASFGRYLNWYHLGLVIFILYYVLSFDLNKKNIALNVILAIVIVIIPFSDMTYFVYNPLNSGSYSTYLKYEDEFKLLNKYTPKESMVYIIDQKDEEGIMAMWHARYYAFPRQTNASSGAINWKIRTKVNGDDLGNWGLTAEEWAKQLKEYNFEYVYLFSSDEYFFDETEFLYDNLEKAKDSTIFKVEIESNNVKLVPIK